MQDKTCKQKHVELQKNMQTHAKKKHSLFNKTCKNMQKRYLCFKKTFKDIQEHATKHETKNIMTIQNIL